MGREKKWKQLWNDFSIGVTDCQARMIYRSFAAFPSIKLFTILAGALFCLVVLGGDSCSEGGGFESQRRILVGHDIFSHWFIVKIVLFVWKRPKINKKGPGLANLKKSFRRLREGSTRLRLPSCGLRFQSRLSTTTTTVIIILSLFRIYQPIRHWMDQRVFQFTTRGRCIKGKQCQTIQLWSKKYLCLQKKSS